MYRKGLIALLSLFIGCAGSGPVIKEPPPLKAQEYLLQPGDELEIKFYYHPELNEKVTIRPDGKISLQLIDEIQAAGRTPGELDEIITQKYAQTLVDPEVTVIVRSSGEVFVGGEVNHPGLIPFKGNLTLLGAIFQAGGFKGSAKISNVLVLRKGRDGNPELIRVNLKKWENDMGLQPYDIVFVPKSRISKIQQFVDQYVEGILPLSSITGFAWVYRIIKVGY